jgi:NADPH:quinone reductase-like Zn-dependent oxidoreductase
MKAIRLHARGGPESLRFEDAPTPRPGAGEVLVRVRAAAVTPTELLWVPTWATRDGGPRPLPVIPGHEFSGEVAALGEGVTAVGVGEAVYGMNDWFGDGAQAEFCLARPADIARKPASVDHAHAAVTPISALTAWQALIERARLAAGERVLIHAGAGAVGTFAVQLARWRGARVLATAATSNLDFVRELGADEVIDYTCVRFEEAARGVDLVLDTVGGETLERSWRVLRPGGRLVTIAADSETTTDPRVRDAFFIVRADRAQLAEVARLVDAGSLRPVVARTLPLAEGRAAYARRAQGSTRGKTALGIAA